MSTHRRSDRKRALALKELPLFSSCTVAELRKVVSVTTELQVGAGDRLTEVGEYGTESFVIVTGYATVWRNGTRIDHLGPGSFFGEMAALDRGARTATVIAETDLRVLVMTRQELLSSQFFIAPIVERMLSVVDRRLRRALEAMPHEASAADEPRATRIEPGLDSAIAS